MFPGKRLSQVGAVLAALSVTACAAPQRAEQVRTPPLPAIPPGPTGLGAVIGQTPEAVLQRFGSAYLDRREGPARHLQFKNAGCIFDVYFYADANSAAHTGRHADARLTDGRTAEPATCIDAQLRALTLSAQTYP
jgi:hypothetical protein